MYKITSFSDTCIQINIQVSCKLGSVGIGVVSKETMIFKLKGELLVIDGLILVVVTHVEATYVGLFYLCVSNKIGFNSDSDNAVNV